MVAVSDSESRGESAVLQLNDDQRRLEHMLSAVICLEFVRVAAPLNPSVTAAYANQVVSNSGY
jgi:hypothetical protein